MTVFEARANPVENGAALCMDSSHQAACGYPTSFSTGTILIDTPAVNSKNRSFPHYPQD